MTPNQLERHTELGLQALARELEGQVPAYQVMQTGRARFDALRAGATVNDYIPLLVYRQTREELRDVVQHGDRHRPAA